MVGDGDDGNWVGDRVGRTGVVGRDRVGGRDGVGVGRDGSRGRWERRRVGGDEDEG